MLGRDLHFLLQVHIFKVGFELKRTDFSGPSTSCRRRRCCCEDGFRKPVKLLGSARRPEQSGEVDPFAVDILIAELVVGS